MGKFKLHFIIIISSLIVLSACNDSETVDGEETYNAEGAPVELIAPASPGSGWDTTARSMLEAIEQEDLVDFPIQVVNEDGADGAMSLANLINQDPDNDHKISVTSSPILHNYILGDSEHSYEEITMIAQIMNDYYSVIVPADSPHETLNDLLEAIMEDPQSISVGAASHDRLSLILMIDDMGGDGGDINFVAYSGGGEMTDALFSGDIDVAITGPTEVAGAVESGDLRYLAVTSPDRLDGLDDVPTAVEQDVDVVIGNWRGIMGPPDMSEEAIDFWETTLEELLETETWEEIASSHQWEIEFRTGDELTDLLEENNEQIITGWEEAGLLD